MKMNTLFRTIGALGFILLLCFGKPAFSGSVTIWKIASLEEVLTYVEGLVTVHDPKSMAFFSDWDNVISQMNGIDLPTREPDSVQILEKIASKIRFSVLTSRGEGKEDFRDICVKLARQMKASLASCQDPGSRNPLEINPALKPGPFEFPAPTIHLRTSQVTYPRSPVKQPTSPSKVYPVFLAAHGIAYAGNPTHSRGGKSLKGLALTTLIDNEFIEGEKPSILLYVDDDWDHIQSVAHAFSDRSETVFLFHFPVQKSNEATPEKQTTRLKREKRLIAPTLPNEESLTEEQHKRPRANEENEPHPQGENVQAQKRLDFDVE